MRQAPAKYGSPLVIGLACRTAVANAVVVAAAAQQQDDPDPGAVIAPATAVTVIIAAQAQQNDDPDNTIVVTTAKSTHNKNTSLR